MGLALSPYSFFGPICCKYIRTAPEYGAAVAT